MASVSGFSQDERRRRWTAAGIAVAFHLAILALFLTSHSRTAVGSGEGQGAMDVALAGFSRGSAPAKTPVVKPAPSLPAAPDPPVPPAPSDQIKPRSVLAIVSDILSIPLPEHSVTPTPFVAAPSPVMVQAMAQAAGAPGAACDIDGAIQTALRADPGAHGAILLIPIKDRSVANAVMMWNGQWVAPAEVGGVVAFDTLRMAIRQIVAAAKPDCRAQEIVGPRFMLIPDGDATFVLVFGNATWRWSDLLADPVPSAFTRPETSWK